MSEEWRIVLYGVSIVCWLGVIVLNIKIARLNRRTRQLNQETLARLRQVQERNDATRQMLQSTHE